MIQETQGCLVIVGVNTDLPKVFWNGHAVQGVETQNGLGTNVL